MDDYVHLTPAHRMLLCQQCKAAVRPGSSIENHFRQLHKLKGQVLRDINDYYSHLDLDDPTTCELPADGSPAIEALPILRGFSCTRCRYLTTVRDSITRHWRVSGHEGDGARSTDVSLQTWVGGRYARYWVVGVRDKAQAVATCQSAIDKEISDFEKESLKASQEHLRKGDIEEGIDRDSPWVKRVRWVHHFGSRDKVDIFDAAQWVKAKTYNTRQGQEDDEAATYERISLLRLGESFDREVHRCTWRLDSVPTETLQWLSSISATEPHGMPFSCKALESSMQKYRAVGQRYLGLCWRAHRIGRDEAFERWGVTFTDDQWGLLVDLVRELDGLAYGTARTVGTYDRLPDDTDTDTDTDETDIEGEDDGGEAAPETQGLDRAVFVFVVASIKQRIGGGLYKNPLLCFCAALGITKQPLGYMPAHLYTGFLAALLWIARLFLLEAFFEREPRDVDEVGAEAVIGFREEHAEWLCAGSHSVFSTIVGWMAYGKGVRKALGGQPSIRWSDDREVLFHSGERVVIDDFKRTARGLVSAAENTLDRLMGGSWQQVGKALDMGRIDDNMIRLGAGQSFATNPNNSWLGAGPRKVIEAIEPLVWDVMRSQWRPGAVRKWLRHLRALRQRLMVITHIWGGQPGRGPEVTTMRHCDSWQLIRNVFIIEGQVMLITDRDKMKAIRDNGHKVARFLPDRIGRMMVAYIAWLLPAEQLLRRASRQPATRVDLYEFLWRDGGGSRVWGTDVLSTVLGREMQAGTGVRIGVSRYRPIAIDMGRQIRGMAIRQQETQAGDDDEDNVEVDPVTGEAVDCGGSWNIVWDIQATHSTRVARQHYGVHIGFPGQLQPEMISTFQEISRLWHQFLESDGPRAGVAEKKRKRLDSRAGEVTDVDILGGLKQLLGAEATWRSEKQRESMSAIMQLKGGGSLICVLPTGAGKSILFMVSAVIQGAGTSVVVVPFAALADDLVERARNMGVDCIQFKSSSTSGREGLQRAARLVVVSAESTTSREFIAYADGLSHAGLMQRIFVDECHTVMMDAGYRHQLGELKGLHRYGCPLVLLTATLPVGLEDWFRGEMLAQSATVVRDRTTKANCRYQVERVLQQQRRGAGGGMATGAVESRAVEIVRGMGAGMTGAHKGVVYCRSTDQCAAVACEIGCESHHSGMGEKERQDARVRWAEGKGHRWIAATSGLGTGIDVEGVVAVVHVDRPWGLVDFVQQTGRGGRRAGEVVESVIVYDGRRWAAKAGANFVEQTNQMHMEEFMATTGCRRAVVSAFMDGVAGERCRDVPGAEACDQCGGDRDSAGKGNKWTRHQADQGRRERALFMWLEEVEDQCPVCHVLQHYMRHSTAREQPGHAKGEWCRHLARRDYADAQRIRFGQLSCCFKCKLPLDWCEDTRTSEVHGNCRYIDKVLPIALFARGVSGLQGMAERDLGVDVSDRAGFFRWLGMERRFHGKRGTNLLALWEAVIWQVYKFAFE